MKYLTTLLFALAVMLVGNAQVSGAKGIGERIKQPITIEGGTSERMTVVFTHKSHRNKGYGCKTCHHESSDDIPFSTCRDCHSTPGARERDPMSMFMAFHAKGTDRSCYGCHSRLAEQDPTAYPQFKGCRPCHMSPGAREAMEAAKAAKK